MMSFTFTASSGLKVGLTGTKEGMSIRQRRAVVRWMANHQVEEARHGDCIGADATFHNIALTDAVRQIVIHPPTNERFRAFCEGGRQGLTQVVILPARPYLVRDHAMVDAIDILLATPLTERETLRSGTWATVRYAKKVGREVGQDLVIFPP
jgi:hypothetical protein